MSRTPIVEVAAAVIWRDDGQVLLGQRPEGKPWAGWWEFPGGKIEAEESPFHALQRELHEELGIEAIEAQPWLTRTFAYPDRTVRLRFFNVRQWQGEPHGRENQQLSWQDPAAPTVAPLLPANAPIMHALRLPPIYAITNLYEMGERRFFEGLEFSLSRGLKLIQVREKQLDADRLAAFAAKVLQMSRPHAARVLLNGEPELARRVGLDGVHLPSTRLLAMDERPRDMLCAASCHDAEELSRAAQLGLDFIVLSPVMRTLSHPDASPIGWEGFATMRHEYPLPVYALGGLQAQDLHAAREHGAHGIAMQRAAWEA